MKQDTYEKLLLDIIKHVCDSEYINNIRKLNTIIQDLNENVNDDYENLKTADVSSEIDWYSDDLINTTSNIAFDTTYDMLKELNEIDDEEFIGRLMEDPAILEYRFNPSELVIETAKLIDL